MEFGRDAAEESVYQEREQLARRTRALDIVENLVASLTEDQLNAILDVPHLFSRATQLRTLKQHPQRRPDKSPCGGVPCGK